MPSQTHNLKNPCKSVFASIAHRFARIFWCGGEIILQIEGLFQEKCVILNFHITHEN